VWIWITVLAVLPLAGSGLLFFRHLLPRLLFSGVYPEGAYVSGRPDLTFNAELADIQSVDQKLQGFFKARGLTLADTRNLRIAAGLHYRHGLLFQFRLAPGKRQRLLRGAKRLRTTGSALIQAGPVEELHARSVDPPESELQAMRADLAYLWTASPYNQLGWWPPPQPDLQGMVVYESPLVWPQPEMAPTHCYIFVCPRTGGIYVAAEGIGT